MDLESYHQRKPEFNFIYSVITEMPLDTKCETTPLLPKKTCKSLKTCKLFNCQGEWLIFEL
jgi:hypothetical protein